MSRPRFLADQDFNEHIVRGVLRVEPAIEIMTARDAGVDEASDTEVLEYAAAHGWIVVSHDVNTMSAAAKQRLAAGQLFNGLFLVHQRTPLAPIINELLMIWASSEAEEWASQIRFLPL